MSQPSTLSVDPDSLRSRLRPMSGRDPHELGRVASTLELLFDLTFVVAVATAAEQLAEMLAEGHVAAGVGSFLFTSFGIIWAWVNYSWFASAFDTDDWLYRILTMVQMVGVAIFTLGIPDLFHAVANGHFDNTVIVIGYVIMRVAMLAQWARAYHDCPVNRRPIRLYMSTLVIAQVLWIGTIWLKDSHLSLGVIFTVTTLCSLVELSGPILAERGDGTPWHAHHIVERHGLLTIITIGEIITGTVLTLKSIRVDAEHSINWPYLALVGVCGIALAFGFWWSYFITPFAEVLHRYRERSFGFGYSHFVIWPALAAVGGGLHLMALSLTSSSDESAHHGVSHVVVACALAIPIGVFVFGLFLAHYCTTRLWAGLHTVILGLSVALLVLAVVLAMAHVSLAIVLAVCTIVPWITVAAFELHDGAKHEAQVLSGLYQHDAEHVAHAEH